MLNIENNNLGEDVFFEKEPCLKKTPVLGIMSVLHMLLMSHHINVCCEFLDSKRTHYSERIYFSNKS